MLKHYKVLLTRNNQGEFISAFQPDWGISIQLNKSDNLSSILRAVKRALEVHIETEDNAGMQFYDASDFTIDDDKYLEDYAGEESLWTLATVDVIPRRKAAQWFLPKLGLSSVFINALCVSIAAFVSVSITLGDDASDAEKSLGIVGGFFNFFLTTFIYYYSSTTTQLATVGRSLDNGLLCRRKNRSVHPLVVNPRSYTISCSCKIILRISQGVFAFLLLGDTITSAITAYQEIESLGHRAEENNQHIPKHLLNAWAIIYSASNAIAWGSFNTNIVFAGSTRVADWIERTCFSSRRRMLDESPSSEEQDLISDQKRSPISLNF